MFDTLMKGMSAPNAFPPEAGARAEAFWRAQAAAAAHMQTYFDDWYERRRQAAEAAAACCAEVAGAGGDMDAAVKVWRRWTEAEVERLNRDAAEQAELATALATDAINAFADNAGAQPERALAHEVSSSKSATTRAAAPSRTKNTKKKTAKKSSK
jgi:hypothetical protein